MRVTDITSVRVPIPEDGTRFERFCESWVVRKVLHPLLELPIRLYFYLRLNWACPIIAIVIMLLISLFVLSEHWWMKQIFISKIHIVHTARANELTVDKIANMTNEQYIMHKFGPKGKLVIEVMQAESGGNPYAINKNTDREGTFDLGCMQLNEKWQLKPRGLTRADAFDCKKSIDVSYTIYQEQGNLCAWSGYKKLYPYACK